MNVKIFPIFSWFVTLATPLALIGLALRILLTPLFIRLEYSLPHFPPDPYGFSREERLRWAPYALNYLLKDVEIDYLGDLKSPDGETLYTERELRHMQDVRLVVQASLRIWYAVIVLLGGLGIWAGFGGWTDQYLAGLRRGSWLMVGSAFVTGLIVLAGISFNPDIFWKFFVGFHSLFFEGDTWLFAYSDTLIRLFPIRFWQDAFLFAAFFALGGGLALGLGLRSR